MFPTTGHLFNAIFGTNTEFPIPTYGLMLSLAFMAAWLVAALEMKRKQKQGLLQPVKEKQITGAAPGYADILSPAIFGFVLGWKFIGIFSNYDSFNSDPAAYFFSTEGNIFVGIVMAAALAVREYRQMKKKQLPKPVSELVDTDVYKLMPVIIIIAATGGIAGAKLFHILENLNEFSNDPWGTLFSTGGLTFFGGLICGTLLVAWYCKTKKLNLLHIMDVTAPAILLAYAIGRTGCMLAGDGCWGVENLNPKPEWLVFLPDWMWAFDFPNNVVKEGVALHNCSGSYCRVLENPVYPTSFYETLINLSFFAILWSIRKIVTIPGILFALLIIMNGTARFFIEKIRVNNKFSLMGMQVTQAEIISVLLVVGGIILAWWLRKKHLKNIEKIQE